MESSEGASPPLVPTDLAHAAAHAGQGVQPYQPLSGPALGTLQVWEASQRGKSLKTEK